MSAPCCTQTVGIPFEINAGDTTIFTEQFTCYSPDEWTMALWLYLLGGAAPISTAATTSGTSFLVTLTAAATASLPEGQYEYTEQVTNIATPTLVYTAKQGVVQVLPNYMIAQTPTFAQQQVTNLQTVLAEFNRTSRRSVNFAGQEFERALITDYQKQLVFYQAAVIREQAERNRLRGGRDPGRITTQFVQPGCTGPYTYGTPFGFNNCQ